MSGEDVRVNAGVAGVSAEAHMSEPPTEEQLEAERERLKAEAIAAADGYVERMERKLVKAAAGHEEAKSSLKAAKAARRELD